MAKILVADDNSNIQKMVGLALKDQGIDVVAVGNGEAAVRKIADVHPDLVLADVFMPVRNGYEVCQFVKGDSALAHIPVILLVGAFDPLDEQEAQRVGADGVLKKPFVPPDPLISMVKSALTRAGISVGGAAPAPAKEEPIHVADMLTPRRPPSTPPPAPVEDFPTVESEPVNEGIAARPEPVRIDAGSQPLAFGSLLESPATAQEEDLGYATTAQPELERDWGAGAEEEEVEEEEEEKSSSAWRRDGGDEAIGRAAGGEEEAASPVTDWRETAFGDAPGRKAGTSSGHWTPQETSNLQQAAEIEHDVRSVVTEMPAAEVKLTSAPTTATLPAVPETPFSQDAWAAALNEPVAPVHTEAPAALEETREAVVLPAIERPASAPVSATPSPAPEAAKAPAESWYSTVSSPWDAEAQKASQLASTWDLPTGGPAANAVPQGIPEVEPGPSAAVQLEPSAMVDVLPPGLSEDVKAKLEEAPLPAATVEAIREETQQVTDTVMMQKPVISAPVAAEPAKPAQPSMEELVAKVLSQMSPEVLQAVTREILKPVVEAMVRDELNAKK